MSAGSKSSGTRQAKTTSFPGLFLGTRLRPKGPLQGWHTVRNILRGPKAGICCGGSFPRVKRHFCENVLLEGKRACPRNMVSYIPLAWVRASRSWDWHQFSISTRVFFSRKISLSQSVSRSPACRRTVLATCALCVHTNDCPRFTQKNCVLAFTLSEKREIIPSQTKSTKSREKLMMTSRGQELHSRSSTRRKTSLC